MTQRPTPTPRAPARRCKSRTLRLPLPQVNNGGTFAGLMNSFQKRKVGLFSGSFSKMMTVAMKRKVTNNVETI